MNSTGHCFCEKCHKEMQPEWAFCPHCGRDNRPPEQRVKVQCQQHDFDYGARCINCGQGVQQMRAPGMLSWGSSGGGGGYGSWYGRRSPIWMGFLGLYLWVEAYEGIVLQRISFSSRYSAYSTTILSGGDAVAAGVCFLIGGTLLMVLAYKGMRSGW